MMKNENYEIFINENVNIECIFFFTFLKINKTIYNLFKIKI